MVTVYFRDGEGKECLVKKGCVASKIIKKMGCSNVLRCISGSRITALGGGSSYSVLADETGKASVFYHFNTGEVEEIPMPGGAPEWRKQGSVCISIGIIDLAEAKDILASQGKSGLECFFSGVVERGVKQTKCVLSREDDHLHGIRHLYN